MNLKFSSTFGYALGISLFCLMLWVVIRQVREHHLQDDPMLHMLREMLIPVHPIFTKIKLYRGDKSYTINKEKTFMCLYDKQGDYYPLNQLVYVLLHEISHSLNTKDIGHTENFQRVFDELLAKATSLGVYNPSIPIVHDYCE